MNMWKSNFFFIALIFFISSAYANEELYNSVTKIDVLNTTFDTVNVFQSDGIQFLILINSYCCHDCFVHLEKSILEQKKNEYKIKIISRCPNDIVVMKNNLVKLKRLFNCKEFYFDIHEEQDAIPPTNSKEGLFGYFKVVQTPALIVFSKEKQQLDFFSYRDLFSNDKQLNKNIEKILKGL
ncbi:MAG: hypothetical protein GX121_01035 [Ignavibacteria bacterium]|nr:hypothetical protein [Ignavibacteria bacterium]